MRLLFLSLLLPLYMLTSLNLIYAQSHAREFDYLVDARSTLIDNSMHDQGYSLVKTDKLGSDTYQYWRNERMGKCITVRINKGRILSVENIPEGECGEGSYKVENYSYTRSSSYVKYNKEEGYTAVSIAYDRGFNDGLRNRTFNNSYYREDVRKDAYADGYDSGYATRKKGDHWSGNTGASYVEYKDLEGWLALRAYEELQNRGFEERQKQQQGGNTYSTWYHSRTGQCINTITRKDRISEMIISTHCDL